MAEKTAGISGGGARDTFTGKTAFVISCIGFAGGLSGIWLFPIVFPRWEVPPI